MLGLKIDQILEEKPAVTTEQPSSLDAFITEESGDNTTQFTNNLSLAEELALKATQLKKV